MPFSLLPRLCLGRYDEVTPDFLRRRRVRLLLCDLDYTLAPKSVAGPDDALRRWMDACREAGTAVAVLSNNRSSRRVDRFCATLGIPYVGHAGKPGVRGFREAMVRSGVTAEETAMLGDKLLTDVLGANRAGVFSIMVEPLGGPVGPWNRFLHLLQRPFKAISKRRSNHEQI